MTTPTWPDAVRTDMHAHWCDHCKGYAPCYGGMPASGWCLLVDSCPVCSEVPTQEATAVTHERIQ